MIANPTDPVEIDSPKGFTKPRALQRRAELRDRQAALGRGLSSLMTADQAEAPRSAALPQVLISGGDDSDEQPSRVYQRAGLLYRLRLTPVDERSTGLSSLMQAYNKVGASPTEVATAKTGAAEIASAAAPAGTEFPLADDYRVVLMDLDLIQPNPFVPLSRIDPEGLRRLRESVKAHGFLRPLMVMPSPMRDLRSRQTFWLVSGERSWQVARILGIDLVPVRICDVSPREAIQMVLADDWHIQRLLPTDQAKLCRVLTTQMGMSTGEVAERLAVEVPEVDSALAFLELEPEIQDSLDRGHITVGAATALLAVPDARLRQHYWHNTVRFGWNAKRITKAYQAR
ncbi:MAG: ParB/RepB/Spo0J family partition protein, partial [Chloroflexota bacterium]